MNRLSFALIAAAFTAAPVSAQVYKCKDAGGTTIFSSQPCGVGAQTVDVRPASGSSRPTAPTQSATAAARGNTDNASPAPRSMAQAADEAARRRILDDDIWRKQRSIDALQEELQTRQQQLRNKKTWANNNLAGAVWEQSISDEMQAVAAEYDIKIRRASKDLDELKAKRAQLR